MNSRKKLLEIMNHKQSPQIPIDFGGTMCSGMHVTCIKMLREYYGLAKIPIRIYEPNQMLGYIDNDLKDILGVDIEGVHPQNTIFGFPNVNWKEWRLDNGIDVLVPEKFNTTKDKEGNTYIYPEGDTSVKPSGRLPKGGYYFDAIIRQGEIDEENINPEDNLEEFKPLSDEGIRYFVTNLKVAADTGRGVIVNFGGTGLGDIALVPGPFMKAPKGIRDITEWYILTATRQDVLHAIFDKQTDIALENMKKINAAAGSLIDVVFICGTDFGTQRGTFCSKDTFTEVYMPYYKKMNNWIHANTDWKTLKHSCGAVEPFMDLIIDAGFDIINPVQCSADGMDPKLLKERYGDRLTFWGGGVDTQKVLPFGTPKEIREQVLQRCEIFSRNGGFVFSAIHNIQAKTPVENIVAMINAVNEFNGRTIGPN